MGWGSGWPYSKVDGEHVQMGNVTLPKRFYLGIRPDEGVAGPGVTMCLCYTATAKEILLAQVIATGVEVPAALDILRKARSMEWWKRFAFMRMVFESADDRLVYGVGDPNAAARGDVWEASMMQTLKEAFSTPISRRRNRLTPSHLVQVAEVYRVAWQDGSPPTKAVAQTFSVSHSTAARWVGAARKAGHLGPADSSRAGEQPPTKQPTKRGTKR